MGLLFCSCLLFPLRTSCPCHPRSVFYFTESLHSKKKLAGNSQFFPSWVLSSPRLLEEITPTQCDLSGGLRESTGKGYVVLTWETMFPPNILSSNPFPTLYKDLLQKKTANCLDIFENVLGEGIIIGLLP